jgi:PTH1 family peptidyl-tRNA hydrolase
MKLIVGLGNPGEKYRNNRHNIGQMAADALLSRNLPRNISVKKTNVFMNESGSEVKKLLGGLDSNNLYIIHDDLDIPLGAYKIQKGKGPKLHNGILSIENELGTPDFWRVRIGVDNRKGDSTPGEEYVLQDFTEEEKEELKEVINKVAQEILSL